MTGTRSLIILSCDEAYRAAIVRTVVRCFGDKSWVVCGGEALPRFFEHHEDRIRVDDVDVTLATRHPGRPKSFLALRRQRWNVVIGSWTGERGMALAKLSVLFVGAASRYVINEQLDMFQLGGPGPRLWPVHVRWRLRERLEAFACAGRRERVLLLYRWTLGVLFGGLVLFPTLWMEGRRWRRRRARMEPSEGHAETR